MKAEFLRVIAASPEDRRGLYLATANRLGTIFVSAPATPGYSVRCDFG